MMKRRCRDCWPWEDRERERGELSGLSRISWNLHVETQKLQIVSDRSEKKHFTFFYMCIWVHSCCSTVKIHIITESRPPRLSDKMAASKTESLGLLMMLILTFDLKKKIVWCTWGLSLKRREDRRSSRKSMYLHWELNSFIFYLFLSRVELRPGEFSSPSHIKTQPITHTTKGNLDRTPKPILHVLWLWGWGATEPRGPPSVSEKTAGELFSSSTVKVRNSMIYSLNLLDFPLINLQVYLAAPSPSQTHSLQHLSTANVPNNHNLGLKPHP